LERCEYGFATQTRSVPPQEFDAIWNIESIPNMHLLRNGDAMAQLRDMRKDDPNVSLLLLNLLGFSKHSLWSQFNNRS
jgi:hypothetical protein